MEYPTTNIVIVPLCVSFYQVLYIYIMFFFHLCEWLQNMYLCMRVIMYISNLFLCCVCFVIIWYVCVTSVFLSLMYIINIINNKN